ncbi:MAG: MerR family transcriptional regulator [Planktomarina sp.]
MMKSKDAYRSISEVAKWLGTQAHVLRYWESKFEIITPIKSKGGRRYYDASAMSVIGGIKHLLHDEGMTIKAVGQLIDEKGPDFISTHSPQLPFGVKDAPRDLSNQTHVDTNVIAFKFDPLPKRRKKPQAAEHVDANGGPQPFLFPELAIVEEDPLALTADFIDRTPGDHTDEPMLNLFANEGEAQQVQTQPPIRMIAKAPALADFPNSLGFAVRVWMHMSPALFGKFQAESANISAALSACSPKV